MIFQVLECPGQPQWLIRQRNDPPATTRIVSCFEEAKALIKHDFHTKKTTCKHTSETVLLHIFCIVKHASWCANFSQERCRQKTISVYAERFCSTKGQGVQEISNQKWDCLGNVRLQPPKI